MPHYKLIYFNMRGRAEIIRYLFAYLDIPYEDHRISQDDWPAVKQSLAGKTELERCQVDAIIDTLDDFMSRFPWAEKKQDIKDQMFNELLTNDAPGFLQDLDLYLGKKDWLVGNSVTWADFYWDICSTTLLVLKHDLLDKHPKLVALGIKVRSIPVIADWIKQRPETRM
ncbi:hematopoietic prostaglandin D synthase isoform X2 [Phascolarctos cinereus]|uniref:glutathione transferase n=1 Tax=Phascolarctos cinereus TaxID=38626 RepID=A0A6P5M019_PHACI|nr:hematopoietic prostaglandin D synthase isoform X2 [Phascolarctos cinereus]